MPNKKYDPILKQQILDSIKYEGITVADASRQYDVSAKLIYTWTNKAGSTSVTNAITGVVRNKSDMLMISKLLQENRELKELLGTTTLDLSKVKKKYNPDQPSGL